MVVCAGSEGTVGGSLTSSTVRVNVALVDSVSSLAVTRMLKVAGVSASSGVPLRVRVSALKFSQPGRESLLDCAAV